MSGNLSVALVATVKNERDNLCEWLAGIARLSRLPDEIVIVDGGSVDGTWELLSGWEAPCDFTLVTAPGTTISAGRNLAMRRVRSDIIAVTDAGTVAEVDWLEQLCRPFEDPSVDVSSGFFCPQAEGLWQRSLAAATLPDLRDIEPETFLPSSRSVAIRSVWVRRGFEYPEWLDYCEDLVWDLQLKRGGARFQMSAGAVVRFAVRPDWPAFARQYYRYARGDGNAGLFGKRHVIRYAMYFMGLMTVFRRRPLEIIICSLAGVAYLYRPIVRLVRRDREDGIIWRSTVLAVPLVALHRLLGDLAKMTGYPVGVAWWFQRYGLSSARRCWRQVRMDGSIWHPSSTAAETPPREE